MSGYEVCRGLREAFGETLPILFVNGPPEFLERVAGLMIGVDDYLVKPLAAIDLLARIGRLLARAKPG
jgi:DNA-binding response OmpR family regulator